MIRTKEQGFLLFAQMLVLYRWIFLEIIQPSSIHPGRMRVGSLVYNENDYAKDKAQGCAGSDVAEKVMEQVHSAESDHCCNKETDDLHPCPCPFGG